MSQTLDQAYKLKGRRFIMNTSNQSVAIFTSFVWGENAPVGFNPTPVAGEIKFSHTSTDNWGGVACAVRHFVPCEGGRVFGFLSRDGKDATVVDPSEREGYQIKGDYLVR